ncbi:MAG TPA: hypothetical protein VK308_07565 [Pyrinomonadaceae bacterium]|nr:hypothetical protein [Pyrinomonadaceae bacterium]
MSFNKRSLLVPLGLSIGFSFLLALITAFSLINGSMDSPDPPLITKILLWNIVLAVYLIGQGILPACKDCEMAILLYVIFYGFIIGLIGYFIVFFGGILLIKKLKKRESPS